MKLRIIQDELAEDPRKISDCFGTMVCWHKRYQLGDKHSFGSPEEFHEWWDKNGKGGVLLPLYLFDHSGLTMNTTGFSCPWDSGQVGYIYVTKQPILDNWGCKSTRKLIEYQDKTRKPALDRARDLLVAEVHEYDQYLTGDVWGYVIEDDDGNHLDSCFGFYGTECCKEEGESALKHLESSSRSEACLI